MIFYFIFFVILLIRNSNATFMADLKIVNDSDPILFNLTFTQNVSVPLFQMFTYNRQLNYVIINKNNSNSYFIIKVNNSNELVSQVISLIFNMPLDIGDGSLDLQDYTLELLVLNGGYIFSKSSIIIFGIFVLISCFVGVSGIALLEFVQNLALSYNYSIFFSQPLQALQDFFFFNWITWQPSLNQNQFINSGTTMVIIVAAIIILTVIVYFTLRYANNTILRYVYNYFNFSFSIVVYLMIFLPLFSAIVQNYILLAKSPPNISSLIVVSNILCILFLLFLILSVILIVMFVNYPENWNFNFYDIDTYTKYHKLYLEINTKKRYKRNYIVFVLIKSLMIVIASLYQNPVLFVLILQILHLFILLLIKPYKDKIFLNFTIYIQLLTLLIFVFVCFQAFFSYLGTYILHYQGNMSIEFISLGIFVLISISSFLFTIYEFILKLKNWKNKSEFREQTEQLVEMTQLSNRQKRQYTVFEATSTDPEKSHYIRRKQTTKFSFKKQR